MQNGIQAQTRNEAHGLFEPLTTLNQDNRRKTAVPDEHNLAFRLPAANFLGSLGISVIDSFWYTDFTENTEKARIFLGFFRENP